MKELTRKLVELKERAVKDNLPLVDIQRKLSTLLLLSEDLDNSERTSKKLDNDLEIAIYTLNPSNQLDAAIVVLNEAIELSK
ncbi:hypothetical protein [Vibrio penaeicida]|uniref:DUF2496 domain-containing protein n=1 Tax=Vibrio penaeicida TaxID=104609 RepID=A0AAV5P076_9VIBR|nr:hypothetical protein [Vibrio penaeicida]RTZ21058.1 hypothetical protein EKN09_21290 [Vibrio penaeicida]GLQ76316.1 hypothetical protein GCM10007932_56790 [Vibrio penaeicida]